MARESKFTKSMKQSYAANHLDFDTTYERTIALLKVYRDAYWCLSEDFEELEEYSYIECGDSEAVITYLTTFAPEKELQFFTDRVQNAAESRLILSLIRRASLRMKDYPNGGAVYYDIISLTYMYYCVNTQEDILDMLDMERSTYFRKKKEAVLLLGYILFGKIIPEHRENPTSRQVCATNLRLNCD